MERPIPIALMPAALAALVAVAAGPAGAAGQYENGASDGTIKLGPTYPYSGPGSRHGGLFRDAERPGRHQWPQDRSRQPRRWLQPAQDRRADTAARRGGW